MLAKWGRETHLGLAEDEGLEGSGGARAGICHDTPANVRQALLDNRVLLIDREANPLEYREGLCNVGKVGRYLEDAICRSRGELAHLVEEGGHVQLRRSPTRRPRRVRVR